MLIVCVDCGVSRPHHAKGRCARCYARNRVQTIECLDCGLTRPEHRGRRCARCYRLARTVEAVCTGCGRRRRCWAGLCQRCKRRRRSTSGACSTCGRQVSRLWSGRCPSCAHSGWSVGSCAHCYAWALSITGQPPCCRACRDFARRNGIGDCRSCQRRLPVNRHQRCRLCTAARRHAGADDPVSADEPAQYGIQLFLGDLRTARRPRAPVRPERYCVVVGDPLPSVGEVVDGQLELISVPPAPAQAGLAAQAWLHSPAGQTAMGELTAFAAARGWRPAILRAVADALGLVAVNDPARWSLTPEVAAQCRRRRLPVSRLREFLTSCCDQTCSDHRRSQTNHFVPAHRWPPAGLPAAISRELTTWLEVLSGARGRTRPHAATTVAAYARVVAPMVDDWAGRYASLREVTTDDVTAQLQPLTGSARTGTTVALRSLFAALKSQRMIFTDPTRRVRPGRFPRRPVLGLDDASRAGLLADTARTDHRLVLLLAGVHALSRAEITALRLDEIDLASRWLLVRGRRVTLDELTHQHLRDWLEERRTRWPATANPHLLITSKSAYGLEPVSTRYFRGLSTPPSRLRADRLLAAATASNGDPLTLVRLFGVSGDTAVRYCTELDQSIQEPRA